MTINANFGNINDGNGVAHSTIQMLSTNACMINFPGGVKSEIQAYFLKAPFFVLTVVYTVYSR